MSRDKQIEEMAKTMCFQSDSCTVKSCVQVNCEKTWLAEALYNAGYRKASDVALEAIDDFQRRLRHIFLDMCNGNDYDTLNLLQIDSAIEALYDAFVAELKKKYTEEGK